MASDGLEAGLMVQRDSATRMAADRVRLLQAIRDHGSISAAARAVGLSYKAAWDAVNTMNNLFGVPLVTASPGGRSGGGASVTPAGLHLIAAFAVVQADLRRFLDSLQSHLAHLAHLGHPDSHPLSTVLWSFLMKTSARNMFRCTITEISQGPISAEVRMALTGDQHLSAIITERSVKELGLAPGKEVFALIKSTFVILATEDGLGKTSVRNRMCGAVMAREDGIINSEIVLDLGNGKSIAAIITRKSAENLQMKPGDRACALVKASHIILAVE